MRDSYKENLIIDGLNDAFADLGWAEKIDHDPGFYLRHMEHFDVNILERALHDLGNNTALDFLKEWRAEAER